MNNWNSLGGTITVSNSLVVNGQFIMNDNSSSLVLDGDSQAFRKFGIITSKVPITVRATHQKGSVEIHEGNNYFRSMRAREVHVKGGKSSFTEEMDLDVLSINDGSCNIANGISSASITLVQGSLSVKGSIKTGEFNWKGTFSLQCSILTRKGGECQEWTLKIAHYVQIVS